MEDRQAFRVAAILWVAYALVTALPVLSSPAFLAQAVVRAGLGLLIAWRLWSRPGRGIAIISTVLSFFSIPLAFLAITNLSVLGPGYLLVAAVGVPLFLASAYCWRLTTRWVVEPD